MKINTATRITFIRIFTIPFLMLFISLSRNSFFWANISFAVFILGSATDWLDGYIARKKNQITNLGKFADQLADKAFVTGILCVLVSTNDVSFWLLALIVIRDISVNGVRMLAASTGKVIAANYWGKWKTVSQLVYIGTVLINIGYGWPNSLTLLLISLSVAFMTIVSGITYFKGIKDFL